MMFNSVTAPTFTGPIHSLTRSSTTPVTLRFWTWREAIEVAIRANAEGRPSVRREGYYDQWGRLTHQWIVRYSARLVLINSA